MAVKVGSCPVPNVVILVLVVLPSTEPYRSVPIITSFVNIPSSKKLNCHWLKLGHVIDNLPWCRLLYDVLYRLRGV